MVEERTMYKIFLELADKYKQAFDDPFGTFEWGLRGTRCRGH